MCEGTVMIHAYSELYLSKARSSLGSLFDYAVYDCHYSIKEVWNAFINSQAARNIEVGDLCFIAGHSGVELAMEIFGVEEEYHPRFDRTPEYWLGWAIAYYQWYRNISFKDINVDIEVLLSLYNPYHEMDIMHFVDRVDRYLNFNSKMSALKAIRIKMELSQKELSLLTGIPLRTIQQYEQKQKDICKARAEYLISLAKVLGCEPSELLR